MYHGLWQQTRSTFQSGWPGIQWTLNAPLVVLRGIVSHNNTGCHDQPAQPLL